VKHETHIEANWLVWRSYGTQKNTPSAKLASITNATLRWFPCTKVQRSSCSVNNTRPTNRTSFANARAHSTVTRKSNTRHAHNYAAHLFGRDPDRPADFGRDLMCAPLNGAWEPNIGWRCPVFVCASSSISLPCERDLRKRKRVASGCANTLSSKVLQLGITKHITRRRGWF